MEVEDEKTGDDDLRNQVQPGGCPDRPQAGVRKHAPGSSGDAPPRNVSDDHSADDGAREGQGSEEQKRGLEPSGALNAGQREGGYCGADRRRGLANAEREASLLAAEPRHHRTAARGVDARARSAGGAKQDDEGGEARRERHRDRERRAEAEPGGEDTTLADAVSRQAPGEQRADRTDPRRGAP